MENEGASSGNSKTTHDMKHETKALVENGTLVAGTGACAAGATTIAVGVATRGATVGASAAAVTDTGAVIGMGVGESIMWKYRERATYSQ